ncbi:MAG: flagellar basal body-associated FliL family protein [Oscillospiraceae bacterium]|jgi:flagellar basal body-associated protein FliL|nr:flagellar basal body-associated FliL family protein [Oscillospiraceae bacterium]
MKKIIIILLAVVIIGGGALYFFVFSGDKDPAEVITEYSPGEFFVTNVKDSPNLLKTMPVLVLNTDKLQERLAAENTKIRDTINAVLSEFNAEALTAADARDKVKEAIISAVNARLEIDNVVDVWFNDFVMQ